MNWIDVTRPLRQDLAGWPGDTPVLLEQRYGVRLLAAGGWRDVAGRDDHADAVGVVAGWRHRMRVKAIRHERRSSAGRC